MQKSWIKNSDPRNKDPHESDAGRHESFAGCNENDAGWEENHWNSPLMIFVHLVSEL